MCSTKITLQRDKQEPKQFRVFVHIFMAIAQWHLSLKEQHSNTITCSITASENGLNLISVCRQWGLDNSVEMVLLIYIWRVHTHELQAAAVKSSLLPFRCRSHLEQGSSQNKSNSSSLSQRKMRKEGNLFHLLHCVSFLHLPRLCNIPWQELWSMSSSRKGTFISPAAVCALRCLRWKGHSHRLHSTWPVYTHPWLSRVMRKRG